MSEAHRVLKPGGVLILNTSSPEQVRKSLWFIAVVPPAAEGLAKRLVAQSWISCSVCLQLLHGIKNHSTLSELECFPLKR